MLPTSPSKTRSTVLADHIRQRINNHTYVPGSQLPTEARIMTEFGVSRTVVREALSHLQAHGLVTTRHGIGSFVTVPIDISPFNVAADQADSLRDTIALLELRIALETEAAVLAAKRRTASNLTRLEAAHAAFGRAIMEGTDAVSADFTFHNEIAKATQNNHFANVMQQVGESSIPRARTAHRGPIDETKRAYLRRVHDEHASLLNAIKNQDTEAARAAARTHLSNSRDRLKARQTTLS